MNLADLKNPYYKLDSHTWDDYIASPMGAGEMESFQGELNNLAGVEADGSPRMRLIWTPDHVEWNVYLKRMMPPQWGFWKAVRDGNEFVEGSPLMVPKYRYVAVPRYAILGRIPPESRWGDTRDRTFYEKGDAFYDEESKTVSLEGGLSVEERDQPEAWKKLLMIFTHSDQSIGNTPLCCLSMAHGEKKKCFGRFRKPDDLDLKYIREKLALSRKVFAAAPHERLTQKDKLNLINGTAERYAQEETARDKEADYISQSVDNDDWFKRPNDSLKGKFSIPGV